ncbi:unnamed protein product [Rhizopus microsporus]
MSTEITTAPPITTTTTTTTRLCHRHQPSSTSFSSASSSSSSTRPALPQILSNSASNAVNFTRSATSTSRRVRSHWFTHFVLNWRRSSRSSKLILGFSMTLVAIQVIASIFVLLASWEMYCDKPLRVFVSVYIVRLVITAPITIYLHLTPRRRSTRITSSPRTSARSELSEAYALSERNRPVSVPPPVTTNNNHRHYPPFVAPAQYSLMADTTSQQMNSNTFRICVDRAKSALDVFAVLWFIIGNYMLFSSTTCSDTAIPLYYLSLCIIIYGYLILSVPIFLCTSVIFCLPCVLVGMRLLHVDDGVYMGGATSEEIAMIPVYRFKSNNSTSSSSSLPEDMITIDLSKVHPYQEKKSSLLDKLWLHLGLIDPPCEKEIELELLEIPDTQDQICVICLSTYEDGDILCKLWCKHHFHKACLHEWLALNFRCPMCKQDSRGKDVISV